MVLVALGPERDQAWIRLATPYAGAAHALALLNMKAELDEINTDGPRWSFRPRYLVRPHRQPVTRAAHHRQTHKLASFLAPKTCEYAPDERRLQATSGRVSKAQRQRVARTNAFSMCFCEGRIV